MSSLLAATASVGELALQAPTAWNMYSIDSNKEYCITLHLVGCTWTKTLMMINLDIHFTWSSASYWVHLDTGQSKVGKKFVMLCFSTIRLEGILERTKHICEDPASSESAHRKRRDWSSCAYVWSIIWIVLWLVSRWGVCSIAWLFMYYFFLSVGWFLSWTFD
jgi:hypothetical protein